MKPESLVIFLSPILKFKKNLQTVPNKSLQNKLEPTKRGQNTSYKNHWATHVFKNDHTMTRGSNFDYIINFSDSS